jgi:hypothetical protein
MVKVEVQLFTNLWWSVRMWPTRRVFAALIHPNTVKPNTIGHELGLYRLFRPIIGLRNINHPLSVGVNKSTSLGLVLTNYVSLLWVKYGRLVSLRYVMITAFWDVIFYRLVGHCQRFGGKICLHHQWEGNCINSIGLRTPAINYFGIRWRNDLASRAGRFAPRRETRYTSYLAIWGRDCVCTPWRWGNPFLCLEGKNIFSAIRPTLIKKP